MDKVKHIQGMNYHSAIKSSEVPIYATTWISGENILSDKRPYMIPFM